MDYNIFKEFSAVNTSLLSPDFSADDIRSYLGEGVDYSILKSVKDAFRTAFRALGVGKGDVVLVQTVGAKTALDAIISLEATPVLIDCEAANWNISAMTLDIAVKNGFLMNNIIPKAVLVKHHLGVPAFMDEILEVCHKHHIPLVEDCIGSFDAKYDGKVCGTIGSFGVYSLASPNNPTCGLGLLIKNSSPAGGSERIDEIIKADQLLFQGELKGSFSYDQWKRELQRRREINELYAKLVNSVDGLTFSQNIFPAVQPSNAYSPVVLNKLKHQGKRDALIGAVKAAGFLGCCPFSPALNTYQPYKHLVFFGCRVSSDICTNGLVLPSQPSLSDNDVQQIVEVVRNFLNNK